jgi:ribosome maturation factor RimP
MGAEEAIADALRATVNAAGLDIWDVECSGASVRVLVERAGGVDLDAVAGVTGPVSAVLDERDDLVPAGRYALEVSSPGLERRLRYPRHFSAYVGQDVAVKTTEAVDGMRRLRGQLVAATDQDVTLRLEADGGGPRDVTLPFALIDRANTVFTWGPPPGKSRAASAGGRRRSTSPDVGRTTAKDAHAGSPPAKEEAR